MHQNLPFLVYTTVAPKVTVHSSIKKAIAVEPPKNPEPKPAVSAVSPGTADSPVSPISPESESPGQSTPQASPRPSGSDSHTAAQNVTHVKEAQPLANRPSDHQVRQQDNLHKAGRDSPLNQALTVIDEHISDLSTPRNSLSGQEKRVSNDSGSDYSSQLHNRLSYFPGEETDEEEEMLNNEAMIRKWSPKQTADHLRGLGVDLKHCNIFEEQEITGDVLLDMDQGFIFMKDFDFGVMGKRLRTWHTIKSFQESVKHSRDNATSKAASRDESSIQSSEPGFLPRIPSLSQHGHFRQHSKSISPNRAASRSSLQKSAAVAPLNHSLRSSGTSRRHSSIDNTLSPTSNRSYEFRNRSFSPSRKSSLDKSWTVLNRELTDKPTVTVDKQHQDLNLERRHSINEPDLGYISGADTESRQESHFAKRQANDDSLSETPSSKTGSSNKPSVIPSPAAVISQKTVVNESPPTVTKLDDDVSKPHSKFGMHGFLSLRHEKDSKSPKIARAMGSRTVSSSVEKSNVISISHASPHLSTSNGSTPHSPVSKSFNSHDSSPRMEGTSHLLRSPARTKTKKNTSAYVRGLEKKMPQEQIVGCDYYGWMKKRSSNVMTAWKPRFFVLRGRRLSYYYSEDDQEEKGLIDISSHKICRADNDPFVSFHAAITGASSSNASPNGPSKRPSLEAFKESDLVKYGSDDGPFIFKIVPPKAGLSRAVQFTKPTVHYFQVDNLEQGRMWLNALIKATIELDLNVPVTTTNKQKTITLKQAAATHQRPPALTDEQDEEGVQEVMDGSG